MHKGVGNVYVVLVPLVASVEESSSKRRRVQFESPSAAARDASFRNLSTDDEVACTPVLPCNPQQAVRLGEVVASELESRTVEPFVAREFPLVCFAFVVGLVGKYIAW